MLYKYCGIEITLSTRKCGLKMKVFLIKKDVFTENIICIGFSDGQL